MLIMRNWLSGDSRGENRHMANRKTVFKKYLFIRYRLK